MKLTKFIAIKSGIERQNDKTGGGFLMLCIVKKVNKKLKKELKFYEMFKLQV